MRTLILRRTVYIHTDHCPNCGMLQKPVNNRRIERVANLIQEYLIAEMKHIDGRSNCLADYLSRPFDDPLFDIPYGLESKLTPSAKSNSIACFPPTADLVSTMTLRPRNKIFPLRPYHSNDNDFAVPAPGSSSSDDTTSFDSPHITTTSSPNIFNSSVLHREQALDTEIRGIINQLHTSRHTDTILSSSFVMKNGTLHQSITPNSLCTQQTTVPYLPSSMVKPLLQPMHDDPYQGGHFSTNKMLSKITSRYWWPRMMQTIQRYVQTCIPYQQYNYSRQKKPGSSSTYSFFCNSTLYH